MNVFNYFFLSTSFAIYEYIDIYQKIDALPLTYFVSGFLKILRVVQ